MTQLLDARAGLQFVRERGVVLASAKGVAPRLIEAILGEAISGNWWGHPKGSAIYNVLREVSESDEILVCRLVEGKITLVHRRLWPALVRVAERFEPQRLAQVREEHQANGRHASRALAFPQWVPQDVLDQSLRLSEAEALAALGPAVVHEPRRAKRRRRQPASTT
jgi:hypothetical protein